ncbi:MAG: response regulator [bacterium]
MENLPDGHVVLYIDDDSVFTDVISHRLEKEGIPCLYAPSWAVAETMLAKDPLPKIILLDVTMPDVDGFEVLRRLKKNARTATIPVLMFSNNIEPEQAVHAKELGAKDYLIKVETSPGEVSNKIKEILKQA